MEQFVGVITSLQRWNQYVHGYEKRFHVSRGSKPSTGNGLASAKRTVAVAVVMQGGMVANTVTAAALSRWKPGSWWTTNDQRRPWRYWWCWWYGQRTSSGEDSSIDDLFVNNGSGAAVTRRRWNIGGSGGGGSRLRSRQRNPRGGAKGGTPGKQGHNRQLAARRIRAVLMALWWCWWAMQDRACNGRAR